MIGIYRVQLQKDDILFCGSDGRDDFYLKSKPTIMHRDDELFLRNIETLQGNLKNIVTWYNENVILADDISIIKICYL